MAFPRGDAHSPVDAPDGAALPAEEIIEGQNLDNYGPVTHSEAVVNRLAEVLFVQMVRAYIAQSNAPPGMLAAIADRQIGVALRLMHQAPQQPWTLAALAQQAGMSRSAFAARFNNLVGQTPMQYLTFWRMQNARELLSETRLGAAAIAERIGYQSEASFGKVFKKIVGSGPGAYRRGLTA